MRPVRFARPFVIRFELSVALDVLLVCPVVALRQDSLGLVDALVTGLWSIIGLWYVVEHGGDVVRHRVSSARRWTPPEDGGPPPVASSREYAGRLNSLLSLPGVSALTHVEIVGRLDLAAGIYDEIVEHAQSDVPFEVCGLLAGPHEVERAYRISNAARSMTYYNMEPKPMLLAMRDIEDRDWELRGIYHSHTHTEAFPSATDIQLAAYPGVAYVIVSLQDPLEPVVRAFDISDGVVTERAVLRSGEEVPSGPR